MASRLVSSVVAMYEISPPKEEENNDSPAPQQINAQPDSMISEIFPQSALDIFQRGHPCVHFSLHHLA